jgi:hypothetical protein
VNFDRFVKGVTQVDPRDPLALYKTLERKQSHVELRDSQGKILDLWAKRRNERDIVLKLATGAGKTTIGLVVLYSHMRETRRPCLFLCPTNQLVGQVCEEAVRCGVPAVSVTGGQEIPPEAISGDAIVVTSVQNVFHAKSGHFSSAKFYAVLVDDAHSAVDIVRQQFRLSVAREDPLFKQILGLFEEPLKKQSLAEYAEVKNAMKSAGAMEVPYWAWNEQAEQVARLITERVKKDDLAYQNDPRTSHGYSLVWGLIKTSMAGTRCVVSNRGLEIGPEIPPVSKVQTYERAERRIFMSATISDESILVRELGCSAEGAANPVELPDAGGIGERMVLVPRLMAASAESSLQWPDLATLCRKLSKNYAVVVLTPSHEDAKQWSQVGAAVVAKSDDVPNAVKALRAGKEKFVVFAARYDGLDLPDEACRVLVLDGAPKAASAIDGIDMLCVGATTTRQRAIMHRIEQGLGRAVRSPADHAVIILFGSDLVTHIARVDTRSELTDQTRRQIEFGMDIAQAAKGDKMKKGDSSASWVSELEQLALQCLTRDAGWKAAYQERAAPQPASPSDRAKQAARIKQASTERVAWEKYVNNQGGEAAQMIRTFLNASGESPPEQAFLLQRAAWYIRREDPAQSLEIQRYAREHDHQLLLPPDGVRYQKETRSNLNAAQRFVAWLRQFTHRNAAIDAIETMRSHLVFAPDSSYDLFERGLLDLGTALGFDSRRPDREAGVGPDNLWLEGQHVVVIEAKNNVQKDTPITKEHAGQLSVSASWASQLYTERSKHFAIIAHPRTILSEEAYLPESVQVLTPEALKGVLEALVRVVTRVESDGDGYNIKSAAELLNKEGLSIDQIVSRHTQGWKRAE